MRKYLVLGTVGLHIGLGACSYSSYTSTPYNSLPDGFGVQSQNSNVIGGGAAIIYSGGDEMRIAYITTGAGGGQGISQSGRSARFSGNEDGLQIEYTTPGIFGVGREVWINGGGDNIQLSDRAPPAAPTAASTAPPLWRRFLWGPR